MSVISRRPTLQSVEKPTIIRLEKKDIQNTPTWISWLVLKRIRLKMLMPTGKHWANMWWFSGYRELHLSTQKGTPDRHRASCMLVWVKWFQIHEFRPTSLTALPCCGERQGKSTISSAERRFQRFGEAYTEFVEMSLYFNKYIIEIEVVNTS